MTAIRISPRLERCSIRYSGYLTPRFASRPHAERGERIARNHPLRAAAQIDAR
jgi:hypothetical protein